MTIAASAGGLLAAGCAKHTSQMAEPPPPSKLVLNQTAQRLSDLQKAMDQLKSDSQQLPGGGPTQHRDIMGNVLADYSKVLPLLAGPNSGLIFKEQMETLNGAREQLAAQSPDLSAEPGIDNGLRATERALSDLSTGEVFSTTPLSKDFDVLIAKLNELDNVHGPLHELVVSEAVEKTNAIIDQMAQILISRLTPPPPPPETESATEPASEPATLPAAEPATMPAAESATMPATEPATHPSAEPQTMPSMNQ
ncbi:MAG TPA: hypothetical protein VHY37_12635 [Tepidisphaeraceae bacterium]|jgi:outer membrane murein-binding lipoprotein Lpp|nr:hypothetical protein [Tepidisphaeraceae bacterium]